MFLNVIIVYWRLDVLYWLIMVLMIFFICWKLFLFFIVLVLRVNKRFVFGMVGGFIWRKREIYSWVEVKGVSWESGGCGWRKWGEGRDGEKEKMKGGEWEKGRGR